MPFPETVTHILHIGSANNPETAAGIDADSTKTYC